MICRIEFSEELNLKQVKKKLKGLLIVAAAAFFMCACGNNTQEELSKTTDKLNIVCASFPEYDWTRKIIGQDNDKFQLILIADNGMDIHNYQPSVEDMALIDDCDLLIYNGGISEQWIEDILADSEKKPKVISMMECLEADVVEEEIIEGMEQEGNHEHDSEEAEHDHDSDNEETEYDEHVWLSLKNAKKIVQEIGNALKTLDSQQSDIYQVNMDTYLEQLEALDTSYEEAVKEAKNNTLLFGDRFPFRYLTKDYGINYYAAFPGCSAETEASFETIVFLAQKVEENHLPCILTIDGSDKSIAQSILGNVKGEAAIKELNSLQAVSEKQIEEGMTYLSVMKSNLEVIKEALQ